MADHPTLGSICAVVVTYNIGNAFDTCFNSLRGQVDHAVIVNTSSDDGTTARAIARLRDADPDFVDTVECPENNLGMAQNMGIAHALERGHDWVLLLDHDSRLGAGMIPAMERAWRDAGNPLNIGILAPNLADGEQRYLRPWFGFWFQQKGFDGDTPVIDHILSLDSLSGCLIPARVLRQEDMRMDEDYIIGHIERDFCLRLVAEGLRILAVRDAKLLYQVGRRRTHRFLGVSVTTTDYSPTRRYYLYRNRLKTWKRHASERPGYLMFDLIRAVCDLWRIILFEDGKNAKLQALSQGVWDALRGVRGPRPGDDITRPGVL